MIRRALLLLAVVSLAPGCAPTPAPADECSSLTAANVDGCLRLNQVQVLGTHNSYHLAPAPALLARLGPRARTLDYTHRPVAEQLATLGIRQFEFDVFADPDGGRYAAPAVLRVLPDLDPPAGPMGEPGLKVLHVQDLDFRSTCPTLEACLVEVRDWSRANPRHLPIMVMIEVKDTPPPDPEGLGLTPPPSFSRREFSELDATIRRVIGDDHLITPDVVRGTHRTLVEAVRAGGWPLLRDARGKVLFGLDNTDDHRRLYLEGAPSLEGRAMFVSSPPDEPSAAFLKLNEALGDEGARIREMVAAGYLVRTRADLPTDEARSGDTARRDSAFASGAQFVSTDYPEESPFGSGYLARLPGVGHLPARCNPVNAPAGCQAAWLEPAQPAP